jgi:hypothetical protein
MLEETIDGLAVLLARYEGYCDSPSAESWRRCTVAHERVLRHLDDQVANQVDPLIQSQIEKGNATPAKALEILQRAELRDEAKEQELAQLVGFDEDETWQFAIAARRALRKNRNELSPKDTAEIRNALKALRSRVRDAFATSVTESRRRKRAHRNDAADYARMQLWMIGAIIVNAEHRGLFHVSYATSVGMARVRPRHRRGLVTPTCERPADRPDSEAGEKMAAA